MDKKIKVLLAIGEKEVESWFMDNIVEYCDIVGVAVYREQILDMINSSMPDVLIFDINKLPARQMNGISVDLLIQKIRTTFKSCRPIVICGNQKPGDDLFVRLVNRGVYDICYGRSVKVQDICDMIFAPKDYEYASVLQALDTSSDKTIGIDENLSPKIVEQIKQSDTVSFQNSESAQGNYLPAVPQNGEIIFHLIEQNNPIVAGQYYPQQNSAHNSNSVLYNSGKILVVTGARQGNGCTSFAINTAYSFALAGKKVLLIDATFGRSCIYQRLGIPENFGHTMEDVVRASIRSNDLARMVMTKAQMQNMDSKKVSFPDNLSFLRFSENFNYYEDVNHFSECLDILSRYYHYIIIDTSLICYQTPVVRTALLKASKVALVMLQDIYEVNTAYELLSGFNEDTDITNKVIPVLNRCIKKGIPKANIVSNIFQANGCIEIADDTYGFMKGYSVGDAPYIYMKPKMQMIYYNLLSQI